MKVNVLFKRLSFIIALVAVISLVTVSTPYHAKADAKSKMQQYVDKMQPGWNLGNTFDATGDETSWGNPKVTKEQIDQIAAAGFKSIRIPITWGHRMGKAPDYTVKPEFMARIKEVVDWSLDAGLYVMINMHHDTDWIFKMTTDHDNVLAKYKALWMQVSDTFRDYPDKLMFESINEPRFDNDWGKDKPEYFELLNELNNAFYEIVRSSGGNNETRPLVIPTLTSSSSMNRLKELKKTMQSLDDENLIATVHYYGYWPFSVNIAGVTTFNEDTRKDVEYTLDRVSRLFVQEGIPVIIGEYGLLGFDQSLGAIQHGEMLKYFEYLNYYARQKDVTLMLWDNGQHFDRRNFTWSDPTLYRVVIDSNNGRTSTAQTDHVYVKKGAQVSDVEIQINLNGNTLKGVYHDDRQLTAGIDYTLDGDMLTLKKSLLEGLVKDDLGVNAVLRLKFSYGSDWLVNVIRYDTPVLQNKIGGVSSFMIPVKFNGDKLSTMEAFYAKGAIAGPQNWTSFKEFNRAFVPSYALGIIQVTQDFFKETSDGNILLKFHFESGEVIDYYLLKKSSAVLGDPSQFPSEQTPEPTEEPTNEPTGQPTDKPSAEPVSGSVDPAASDEPDPASDNPADSGDSGSWAVYILFAALVLAAFTLSAAYIINKKRKS